MCYQLNGHSQHTWQMGTYTLEAMSSNILKLDFPEDKVHVESLQTLQIKQMWRDFIYKEYRLYCFYLYHFFMAKKGKIFIGTSKRKRLIHRVIDCNFYDFHFQVWCPLELVLHTIAQVILPFILMNIVFLIGLSKWIDYRLMNI